jgi:hypothetical protein
LIGSFLPEGLLIVTAEKGQLTEISYSGAHTLVTFFWGFILWQQGTCFYVWLWYKIERRSKHSAIWFILGGYAPSCKSDNLLFRCSFYSLNSYQAYILHGLFLFQSWQNHSFFTKNFKTSSDLIVNNADNDQTAQIFILAVCMSKSSDFHSVSLLVGWGNIKLVRQQYTAWSDCVDVQASLAQYWWHLPTTLGSSSWRVMLLKSKMISLCH